MKTNKKATKSDMEAMLNAPKGWFSAFDMPFFIKRPRYRCDRLEKQGILEARVSGAFPTVWKEYRLKSKRIGEMPKTLCLDFDGVIHRYDSGWQGASKAIDPPVPGAIEFMHEALNAGWDVAVFSSRSSAPGGVLCMTDYIARHAGAHDPDLWRDRPGSFGLVNVRFPTEKPPAILTLDDRAWLFTGKFPKLEAIDAFKPWNR